MFLKSYRFGSSGANKQADHDDDTDDSDEEGQAFYAGGSEQSGQQILGPSKKKDGADFVKHMFKKAKEHGAEAVDPNSGAAGGPGASRMAFTGSGFKLGSNGTYSRVSNKRPWTLMFFQSRCHPRRSYLIPRRL